MWRDACGAGALNKFWHHVTCCCGHSVLHHDTLKMAEKEHRKRKRPSAGIEAPSKKVALDGAPSRPIKVSFRNDLTLPVLASSPGLSAPSVHFKAFGRPHSKEPNGSRPGSTSHELLLHSSQHPRLDYTAAPVALEKNLSHYVAVYDPASDQLQVFPAHHLSLRSALRQSDDDLTSGSKPRTAAQQRLALGMEFGSVRSRRALEGRAANAIVASEPGKRNKAESAVLEAMAESEDVQARKAEEAEIAFATRPIPKPNAAADTVEDVYTFNTLLPPAAARLVNTKEWRDNARAEVVMVLGHRFTANRVAEVGKSDNAARLQALNYLALLLEFHELLGAGGRSGRKVPRREVLEQKLSDWPAALVDSVVRRFANPQRELPKWHVDQLYAHICALALFVDGWSTDVSDLRDDLHLNTKQITQYYRELGCGVRALTKSEQERMKLNNAEKAAKRIAVLKLPLDFPKPSVGRRKG